MVARKINGVWCVDFRLERKRIRKQSPVNTKKGAQSFEQRLINDYYNPKKEVAKERSILTFESFAAQWFEVEVIPNRKPSTADTIESVLKTHLVPYFGRRRLNAITGMQIARYKAQQTKAGLKAKTVNNHLTYLRSCLSKAIEWGELTNLPSFTWMKTQKPVHRFLSRHEASLLIEALADHERPMVLCALHAGLRRGELLGLQWKHVNFNTGDLTVTQSLWKDTLGTTKSYQARHIPMTRQLETLLRRKQRIGQWVFGKANGQPNTKDSIKRILPRACKRAGIETIQWHGLRHTFATQLVQSGVPLNAVQALLGHQDIKTTMRYAHLGENSLKMAVKFLESEPSLALVN